MKPVWIIQAWPTGCHTEPSLDPLAHRSPDSTQRARTRLSSLARRRGDHMHMRSTDRRPVRHACESDCYGPARPDGPPRGPTSPFPSHPCPRCRPAGRDRSFRSIGLPSRQVRRAASSMPCRQSVLTAAGGSRRCPTSSSPLDEGEGGDGDQRPVAEAVAEEQVAARARSGSRQRSLDREQQRRAALLPRVLKCCGHAGRRYVKKSKSAKYDSK